MPDIIIYCYWWQNIIDVDVRGGTFDGGTNYCAFRISLILGRWHVNRRYAPRMHPIPQTNNPGGMSILASLRYGGLLKVLASNYIECKMNEGKTF